MERGRWSLAEDRCFSPFMSAVVVFDRWSMSLSSSTSSSSCGYIEIVSWSQPDQPPYCWIEVRDRWNDRTAGDANVVCVCVCWRGAIWLSYTIEKIVRGVVTCGRILRGSRRVCLCVCVWVCKCRIRGMCWVIRGYGRIIHWNGVIGTIDAGVLCVIVLECVCVYWRII